MKKLINLCLLGLLVLACKQPGNPKSLVSVDAQVKVPSAEQNLNEKAQDLSERKAIQKAWFDAAELVVRQTHDAEAQAVLAHLAANVYVVKPTSAGSAEVLENATGKINPIALVIVTTKDLAASDDLRKRVLGGGQAAEYYPIPSVLMLYPQELSPTWKGLLFLHEGAHAKTFAERPYDFRDSFVNAEKEVQVHEFENRLLLSVGGEAYMDLLKAEAARIQELVLAQNAGPNKTVVIGMSAYNLLLDKVFGAAVSTHEQLLRQTHFFIQAEFVALEHLYAAGGQQKILEQKTYWFQAFRQQSQAPK